MSGRRQPSKTTENFLHAKCKIYFIMINHQFAQN